MDYSVRSAGGLDLAGEAPVRLLAGDDCRLVLNSAGLRNTLVAARSAYEGHYKAGLFQNDFQPRFTMLTSDIVDANFSGYAGLSPTFSWTAPAFNGGFAVMTAHDIVWSHNGGPTGNFVFGYYVVDGTGALVWAERFCPAPMAISRLGERIRIVPTIYLVNDLVV